VEAASFYKTPVTFYHTTWCDIPENISTALRTSNVDYNLALCKTETEICELSHENQQLIRWNKNLEPVLFFGCLNVWAKFIKNYY
jgi:hypothetical protein